MSRLNLVSTDKAQETLEELYKDLERRINSDQPGICPVDMTLAFITLTHAQSCGKCTPCRAGLGRLEDLIRSVLDGKASQATLDLIEKTADAIFNSADCAIGSEAARMVLKGIKGFREDFEEHIVHGRCLCASFKPVPCVSNCPAGVDIPGYIALVNAGWYQDAVELIRKDNPLPATCGLICEHPCEAKCRRNMVDDAINIRGLKRFAVEHEGEIPSPRLSEPTGKSVAVIGGGPSGLTAAYFLSKMGHKVKVFEQRDKLGGMLRYGIPGYRLPREILDHEIEGLLKAGFETQTGVSIGKDIPIDEIRKSFDAVYIAIGAHTDKKIGIEGEDAEGVISAVTMLRAIGDGDYPDFSGQDIVVVGGGNVAMDVARTAVRCGAKSVQVAYRRRKVDMTALAEEVEGAIADGCEIVELNAPVRIEKNAGGKVAAIWLKPQIVGEIKWGRPAPCDSSEPEIRIPCDKVLVAIGQNIDSGKFGEYGIPLKRANIDASDSAEIKELDGMFGGGDCVTGPATVIKAIAAGKVAAANIDRYLGFDHKIGSDIELPPVSFRDRDPMGRVNMTERPACERVKDFCLMEHPMTEEEARQESSRCLRCDFFGYGRFKGGRVDKW